MSRRISTLSLFLSSLGLCLVAGCDKKSPESDAAPDAAVVEEAEDDAKEERKSKKDDSADKGTAVLKLGDDGEEWKAKRASARIKEDGSLRIMASVYSQTDEQAARRAITLYVKDYKGKGQYVIKNMSSNLTAVKLNLGKLKAADKEKDATKADAARTDVAMDGLKGGSVMLLRDAKVEITEVTDDFIDGKIEWSGIALNGANKLKGDFHAVIKK
jgi:hypothetical protein